MKMCFVHEEYPNETNFGGIATYQKIVAEYYANNGNEVYVICRGKKDKYYIENNVHIYRIGAKNDSNSVKSVKIYRKKISKKLIELQNNKKIEIIETPDWGANTIYFEKYRRIPLVVRFHTPLKIWLQYNNNYFGKSKDLILKWENEIIKNASALTSCSELLKKLLLHNYKINKKITVIPNPCNKNDFYYNSNNKTNNNLIYIGSLEERKGVITLAKALNKIMDKLKNNIVYFVGKDTDRNNINISTKEYILSIIDKKYHKRLKFIGQINNKEINKYLNLSNLAIFPSTFDNYPYVVLEAMLAGKNIVISDNTGITDIVRENNYVFKSNDENDLAKQVLKFYEEKKPFFNEKNVKKAIVTCNTKKICEITKSLYQKTIEKYELSINEIAKQVLKEIKDNSGIKTIQKINNTLANDIYIITTNNNKYVLKKYNYNYNFRLSNILYNLYEENNIKVVRPINKKIITIQTNKYNIFKYIKTDNQEIENEYFIKLINTKRKVLIKANLLKKCNKYYYNLLNKKQYKIKEELYIINEYKKLMNKKIFYNKYINHGDISPNNIIINNNNAYLIDFDEAIVTTELYDVAVLIVKNKINDDNIDFKSIKYIINSFNKKYTEKDLKNTIKIYLCKILLEKFYLYENNIINLLSKSQLQDDYKKYIKIYKIINNKELIK